MFVKGLMNVSEMFTIVNLIFDNILIEVSEMRYLIV